MNTPTGYSALDLVGFTDKDAYSSSENYVKNDLVHYGGNIWRCLIDDTSGIAPAEGVNWTLFIGEPTNLVERIIAPVETNPATNAYAVGTQLIFNGLLCKATSAIAVGDTLAVGTNLALSDNVVEQIYSLNQGLTNSLDNLSHENLLDNPWFTVNQRGVTNDWTAQFSYGVDRWRKASDDTITINVTSDGIKRSDTGGSVSFFQVLDIDDLEIKKLFGRTITASCLYSDGTIEYGTVDLLATDYKPSARTIRFFITQQDNKSHTDYLQIENYTNESNFVVGIKAGYTLRAVKLEIGNMSTLANDTAPNYATELLKCQRYFQRIKIKTNYAMLGLARAVSATSAQGFITPNVPLRTYPSFTVSNIGSLSFFARSTSYSISNIVMGTCSYNNSDVVGIQLQFTSSGLTTDDLLSFAGNNAVSSNAPYLDFSADL